MALTKITSPTSEVAGKYNGHPEAKALMQPTHTPTQYTEALQKGNYSQDHIHFLAHGMPERESVGWACKSSAKVGDKLEPADKSAMHAAHEWVKNPTPANKSAAAAAAAKTNYQGPGAWAAQGAAWSKTPGAPATGAAPNLTGHAVSGSVMLSAAKASGKMPASSTASTAPTSSTASSASTSPKSAMSFKSPTAPTAPTSPTAPQMAAPKTPTAPPPQTPAERAEMAKIHQPFIDQGHAIASGQEPFI